MQVPITLFVIPADPGIQYFQRVVEKPDPVVQRGDGFLRYHQNCLQVKTILLTMLN